MSEDILLDDDQFGTSNLRRRDLLPLWIKVFIWMFMLFGALMPVAWIAGIAGTSFKISLYGFQTFEPLSLLGILLMALFAFKGVVAFGLWTEKDWAVQLAIIDGAIGIAICVFATVGLPLINGMGRNFNFRLELIPLIPYLLKMRKIQKEWSERRVGA